MLRILNAEPEGYSEEARAILREIGDLVEEPVRQECLVDRVLGFNVLIVRLGLLVTRDVLEAADHLRAVVTAATGLDHIDLEAAKSQGVAILSLQGEIDFLRGIPATAEHTWALLLALIRNVPWAFDDVRDGGWNRDRFRGHELRGRRLGILGFGRTGEQVAHYGRTFGMEVGAYDPHRKDWINAVYRFDTPEELLRWSDVLSVHLPLNEYTRGFLNERRLRNLPRGAWLVNTSRGPVIDEHVLIKLLEEGCLRGAAVDVLAIEQPLQRRERSPLLQYARTHDNLLVTPHVGGATFESMLRTEVFMAEKLRTFLRNQLASTFRSDNADMSGSSVCADTHDPEAPNVPKTVEE
jgi:D-3-phosphoglycerate dehydrogenase